MHRVVAYFFILIGLSYLVGAAYDEYRGIARDISPRSYQHDNPVSKDNDPKKFHEFIQAEWAGGPIYILGGLFILWIIPRLLDTPEPFSPDLTEEAPSDELDEARAEEQRRRDHPLE